MIAKLRARHRHASIALALVAPSALAAGLLARRPMPVMERAPAAARVELAGELRALPEVRFGDLPVRASSGTSAAGAAMLALETLRDLEQPDLLVYWIEGELDGTAGVPSGARLLGSLGGSGTHLYELPAGARAGALLLYGLAHQERVASARIALR